ncbi:hypothetical protein RIF29_23973 [Crotalaria pallida]|uniref:Uncharacterized protein n=1 Tax=Crotalaria pallida TaxID=3830 RepID=A0AAN9HYG3_CROPI
MDAAATEQLDNGVKTKLKKLREAALRIEDVNEDYMISEQRQQTRDDTRCAAIPCLIVDFIKSTFLRLRISYEIQDINSTILEIKEKKSGLQSQSSFEHGSSSGSKNVPPQQQHALRRNALYVEEDEVVGFEAPRAELMGWLKEDRINRTVIGVVGMGGQGKTTLAKTIFDKVGGDFDCYAWITVSQTYTVEGLLRAMLEKFFKEIKEELDKISELDLDSLIQKVRDYLQQKRYVIFFDDVWNKDFWSQIRSAVRDDKKGSRIVITTRDADVANMCKESFVHILNLNPLSQQQSLELFFKKAFRNEPGGLCPSRFEEISSKIVEKCEGLPLAIVAVGSLLASKEKNLNEWQKICQTLVSMLEKNPKSTGITNILGLSYDFLSHDLKSCFLYFGIYPEDHEVESKRLIRQWIAEGFVKPKSHENLEEVAKEYLNELVNRSLVQVSSFTIDGKPKRCRVHDLLHEMILTKIKDFSFCHFIGNGEDDSSMLNGEIRRLQIAGEEIPRLQIASGMIQRCLQIASNSIDHSNVKTVEGSFIQSLYVFREELSEDFVKMILTKCKRLKVIDFQDMEISNYKLECLGDLIHLRYLSFKNTQLQDLPMSIGNLHNLETLDLRGTYIKQLPTEIKKVRKLRHLLHHRGLELMEGMGSFEFLQTLYMVKVGDHGDELIKELEKLTQLRSLGIFLLPSYKKNVSALCSSINNMQLLHLEKLFIDATKTKESIDFGSISLTPMLQKLILGGKLERFQEWILKCRNIVKLTLANSSLTEDPLKQLKCLPNLLFLRLADAYEGQRLHFENDGGFQKLKKLELYDLWILNSIYIDEGALPSLKELKLFEIPNLKVVPFGIHHLAKLEVFDAMYMSSEFNKSVQETAWIHNNVARVHIPYLSLMFNSRFRKFRALVAGKKSRS